MSLKTRTHKNERHIFKQENKFNSEQYLGCKYTCKSKLLREHIHQKMLQYLRTFKKKYGDPCDVVAKDKCFYFAHNEDTDEDGDTKETKSHFDFGLFGNLNGSEYDSDEGKKFAVAYFREDLKAMDCNPDIYAQQNENKDNPHKTKHVDECMKALGKVGNSYSSRDDSTGMTKTFDDQYYLDVIGTSYCRSRAIACTKDEYTHV